MGRRRKLPGLGSERGQTAVELALVLPILVLLVFGTLELGRVLHAWVVVTQASREGARTAAVQCSLDPGCSAAVLIRIDGSLGGLDPTGTRSTLSTGPYIPGSPVTVRVEHDVPLITPLIGALFPGGPVTVAGETTMRLE